MHNIINKIKKDTKEDSSIFIREMTIGKSKIDIIFNETLVSSNTLSDFIIRSLNKFHGEKIYEQIKNNIDLIKWIDIKNYNDLCFYLNNGYTIIIINDENKIIGLETKKDLSRSIQTPNTETTLRGANDAFVEDIEKNIGLIRKRIKSNSLRNNKFFIGRYTKTNISLLAIKGICKKELYEKVKSKLINIDIDGIINSEQIKKIIEDNNFPMPTILTTERPDIASNALLEGKIAIVVDNSPYVLIIPGLFYDFFKTAEDTYYKSINTTITRIIRYLAFFVAL